MRLTNDSRANVCLLNGGGGGGVILRSVGEGTRSGKVEESRRRRALGYLAFTSTIHFAQRALQRAPCLPPFLILQASVRARAFFTLVGKAAYARFSRVFLVREKRMRNETGTRREREVKKGEENEEEGERGDKGYGGEPRCAVVRGHIHDRAG